MIDRSQDRPRFSSHNQTLPAWTFTCLLRASKMSISNPVSICPSSAKINNKTIEKKQGWPTWEYSLMTNLLLFLCWTSPCRFWQERIESLVYRQRPYGNPERTMSRRLTYVRCLSSVNIPGKEKYGEKKLKTSDAKSSQSTWHLLF